MRMRYSRPRALATELSARERASLTPELHAALADLAGLLRVQGVPRRTLYRPNPWPAAPLLFVGGTRSVRRIAARSLAADLGLRMLYVDARSLVARYIGETEKQLSRVFRQAGHGGALLLFEEADALFGRRTRVTDRHARYANIETSYLLARSADYHGLVILATQQRRAAATQIAAASMNFGSGRRPS